MKIVKYIILLLLLFVVAAAIYVATQDNNYNVIRTKTIAAPISVVYDQIIDFKKWPAWSPWIEQEPNAKLTYGSESAGAGASYSWDGEIIGSGNMETLGVHAPDSIAQKITFTAPFESSSAIFWNLKAVEGGTEVSWSMQGKMDFMMKGYMAFAGGMEKQVGPDFERGLTKLDSVTIKSIEGFSVKVEGEVEHSGGFYVYNSASTNMDQVGAKIQELMPKVGMYIAQHNITQAGMPFTLYHKIDQENNAVIMSCAVPVSEKVKLAPDSGLLVGELKPFKAVKVILTGNYTNLQAAWSAGYEYLDSKQLEKSELKPALEVYANDPGNVPNPANWITELYIPIK